jgi:protein ImuB
VTAGLRRREAQGRCPTLTVIDADPARDVRGFEPVAAALEALTPRLELTVPGRGAFPTRGPSRYFGGDTLLAERAAQLAAGALGGRGPVYVGVADGPFAATLAATAPSSVARSRREPAGTRHSYTVVPPGASPAFLAPFPLDALGAAFLDLVDVLGRLGLRTLGDLAALPGSAMLGRFGPDGATAHRLATGLDERPPATRPPPAEWAVDTELDPPADRVDTVAFAARALAEQLHDRVASQGLACARVVVTAETEHGERHERVWRADGAGGGAAFTAGAIADRVRWQLDGWLNGAIQHRPTAGVSRLRLAPDEVVPARGRQLGFWGGAAGADERAVRALARLEGLLGSDAVTVPEVRGGRGPGERVVLVPAGAVDLDGERPAARLDHVTEPWPGRIPEPAPATVAPEPVPVVVEAADGRAVGVTGRGTVTAVPAMVRVGTGDRAYPAQVVAWAGPWPAEERWWDGADARRRARMQVLTADGVARLLTLEAGQWWVEGIYD